MNQLWNRGEVNAGVAKIRRAQLKGTIVTRSSSASDRNTKWRPRIWPPIVWPRDSPGQQPGPTRGQLIRDASIVKSICHSTIFRTLWFLQPCSRLNFWTKRVLVVWNSRRHWNTCHQTLTRCAWSGQCCWLWCCRHWSCRQWCWRQWCHRCWCWGRNTTRAEIHSVQLDWGELGFLVSRETKLETKLGKVVLLPGKVGRALQGKCLTRSREFALPKGEWVEGQVGLEVKLEAVEVGGQLELDLALPVARPTASVNYQGGTRSCTTSI